MARKITRNLIRFTFRHPFMAAMSVLACIVIIVVVIGSSGSSPQPIEAGNQPTTTPQQQTPSQNGGDNGGGNAGAVPLTPGGGGNNPTPPSKPEQPQQSPSPGVKKAAPDPFDDPTSHVHAEADAQIAAQPIIQKLPVSSDGISADLTDRTPAGQLVITVTYSGSLPKAKQAWNRLLHKYHDPGNYFVVFKK